jgi:tetratricopeptide (TPR) repeat protein
MKRIASFLFVVAGVFGTMASLSACRTPPRGPRTDPEIARAAQVARMSFERGSIEQAERLYARALRLARAADDAWEGGTLAYDLAMCRAEQGRLDDALKALAEARNDYERVGRSVEEINLLEAEIARRQGRYDDALALLAAWRKTENKKKRESMAFSEHAIMAGLVELRILHDQGNASEAQRRLEEIQRIAKKRVLSAELQAQVARAEGELALADGKPGAAAAAFEREAEVWRGAKQYGRMAAAMGRAAEAYKAAGAIKPALERFYLAARSLAAQGDDVGALKLIQTALDGVGESGDGTQLLLIANLFEEIKARTSKE